MQYVALVRTSVILLVNSYHVNIIIWTLACVRLAQSTTRAVARVMANRVVRPNRARCQRALHVNLQRDRFLRLSVFESVPTTPHFEGCRCRPGPPPGSPGWIHSWLIAIKITLIQSSTQGESPAFSPLERVPREARRKRRALVRKQKPRVGGISAEFKPRTGVFFYGLRRLAKITYPIPAFGRMV
jgi:hypothetical protein